MSNDADESKPGILEAISMMNIQGFLSMLPLVIYEDSIRLFNFYFDGAVRQGMSYKSRLYKLVKTCHRTNRLQIYHLGCNLANHGIETIITASERQYKVWVEVSAEVSLESPLCVSTVN